MGEIKTDQAIIGNAPTDPNHAITLNYLNTQSIAQIKGYNYCFRKDNGVGQSQTITIFDQNGLFDHVYIPSNGNVIKATIRSTTARTAGTITAQIWKYSGAGPWVHLSALDVVLDGTTPDRNISEAAIDLPALAITQGDFLQVRLVSDASFTPNTSNIEVFLYVVLDASP